MSKQRLGEILIQQGKIDAAQLHSALGHQRRWGKKLGECLIQMGIVEEIEICQTLAKALKIPIIDLSKLDASRITRDILNTVSLQQARSHRVVPLAVKEIRGRKRLVVASSDPTNLRIVDELQFKTGLTVLVMIATDTDIDWFIRKQYLGETEVLPFNYISGISPIEHDDDRLELDPVSSIFFDTEFTGVTNVGKGSPRVSFSKSKNRASGSKPKKP